MPSVVGWWVVTWVHYSSRVRLQSSFEGSSKFVLRESKVRPGDGTEGGGKNAVISTIETSKMSCSKHVIRGRE
jgi:hypothetical protein